MNRVTIDGAALHHNIRLIDGWMHSHGAQWALVTKALCGHGETLNALADMQVPAFADSRLFNLRAIREHAPEVSTWYLRLPHYAAIPQIVKMTDVSLNSEEEIIIALNDEAQKQGKIHGVIVMIEVGDLREGILPGHLVGFYENILALPNIRVLGIGANIGCLSGAVPNPDQFMQLALYRELLELKFKKKLPLISAGASSALPLLLESGLPSGINHFRIGEAVFLGTDLVRGGILPGLRSDAITLEAEVLEIKEKSLIPLGDTSLITPFETSFEQPDIEGSVARRGYRAIVSVGQLDTDIGGLVPRNPDYKLAGASSDVAVLNVGEDDAGLSIGDVVKFDVNYSALVRLMNNRYTDRVLLPEPHARAEALLPA
ncbi:MAG: alanine racemase [Calditrichaeota bacterium]|nr:alanine racemase [Calditrichota bacterium]MCB9367060.1 alanine racemase [Calditrichota bacterium]